MVEVSYLIQLCPACGNAQLYINPAGYIVCGYEDCPNQSAASIILSDPELHHIVAIGEETFTVRHPLIERADDAMLDCSLHEWLANLAGPPRRPGRYRVIAQGDAGWHAATWQVLE